MLLAGAQADGLRADMVKMAALAGCSVEQVQRTATRGGHKGGHKEGAFSNSAVSSAEMDRLIGEWGGGGVEKVRFHGRGWLCSFPKGEQNFPFR